LGALEAVLDDGWVGFSEVESSAIDFLVAPQARRWTAVKGGEAVPGGT
jgi:hypothetical protein